MSADMTTCKFCQRATNWEHELCRDCEETERGINDLLGGFETFTQSDKGKRIVLEACLKMLKDLGVTREWMTNIVAHADLGILVERAILRFNRLSPKEQAEHRRAQAISFAYGNLKLSGRDVSYEFVEEVYNKLRKEEHGEGTLRADQERGELRQMASPTPSDEEGDR